MDGLSLYRLATEGAGWPIRRYLRRRLARGKEDPARLGERMGEPSLPRPDGPLVWIHAASVGEAMSVLTLIGEIRRRHDALSVLVTTGTLTSARLLAQRLPVGAIHQFVPVDRAAWARRFLDHWRPNLALWVESELWPNLLSACRDRGIPTVLLNARMSERSFRNWRRAPRSAARLLNCFALCLAQDDIMAGRLQALGAREVRTVGNLKYGAAALPCDGTELERLKDAIGERPLWLAASTHPGEEAHVAAAHEALAENHTGLLTIVVPRHPERGEEVAELLRARGLATARRSRGETPAADTQVYLADTLGELGLFYRLAGLAFLGGSLVPVGGHNPVEPARLGCAVVFGPQMTNFAAIAERFLHEEAAVQVAGADELAPAIGRFLNDGDGRRELAGRGQTVAEREAGVLDRVLQELDPFLSRAAETETADART